MTKFRIIKTSEKTPYGWKVATVEDVQNHSNEAKQAFYDVNGEWHICKLRGGGMKGYGSGYDFKVEVGRTAGMGDKLIKEHNAVFKCVGFNDQCQPGWKLAKYKDVKRHYNEVKAVTNMEEWCIAALKKGELKGPGYGYELVKGNKQSGYGHKIIIDHWNYNSSSSSSDTD